MVKLSRPASLDRLERKRSKKEEFLAEMRHQMEYYAQVYDDHFKK